VQHAHSTASARRCQPGGPLEALRDRWPAAEARLEITRRTGGKLARDPEAFFAD
jgi:hypothetical protein